MRPFHAALLSCLCLVALPARAHSTEVSSQAEPRQLEPSAPPVQSTAALESFSFLGGRGVSLGLSVEGAHLGLYGRAQALETADVRVLSGVDLHVGLALHSRPSSRFTLDVGLSTLSEAETTAVGPSFGLSTSFLLLGTLGLEASAHFTSFPYALLDARACLALGLGPLGLRLGARSLLLNDAGLFGSVGRIDGYAGPYFGAALVF